MSIWKLSLLKKTQERQEGGLSCPPVFLFPVAGVGKPPLPEHLCFSQDLAGAWPVGKLLTRQRRAPERGTRWNKQGQIVA